jgi:hypothetical protein
VQSLSTREGFVYVETYQDTWERTTDGWSLAQRVSLQSHYEAPEPDSETVRSVAADVRRLAVPLIPVGAPVSSECFALHRTDMPAGAAETVLSAAGVRAFFLDVSLVPAQSALGRWLAEPHLFGGRPAQLGKSCRGIVFVEAAANVVN